MNRVFNKRILLFALLIILILTPAQSEIFSQNIDEFGTSSKVYPQVTIPNTELRIYHSKIMIQDFEICIRLPWNYYKDTVTTYPVMYMTDANYMYPLVANILNFITVPRRDIPEIILVGISYKIQDMGDWITWRTRDLTPTNVTKVDNYWNALLTEMTKMTGRRYEVKSGGASKFLKFILEELIPFIESQYRVSQTERALSGYSFGGLFTLYTLFTHPGFFKRYFAGSPPIGYDDGVLFRYKEEFAISNQDVTAKIFSSAGSLEDSSRINNVKRIDEKLNSLNYAGIELHSQLFDNEDHYSCIPAAFMRALSFLYKRKTK